MQYSNTTCFPNEILDHLSSFTNAEFKVVGTIVRQTYGWVDKRTGRRKKRDWISHSQFVKKTGLSRRIVSTAIASLLQRGVIAVYNAKGKRLFTPKQRRGKRLYYSVVRAVQKSNLGSAKTITKEVQKVIHNKTNSTKNTITKKKSLKNCIETTRRDCSIHTQTSKVPNSSQAEAVEKC